VAVILLTRPQAQSEALAEPLRALGWTPLIAPMLTLEILPPPPGFEAMVETAGALAFTSANGVRAFEAASPRRESPVYAVGDATETAARETGFSATRSAAGDADALSRLIVSDPPDGPILHIRGEHGRGDLAARLNAVGIAATEAVLYAMRPADALPEEAAQALAAGRVQAASFYSPRTAHIFAALAKKANLAPLSAMRAVAISAAAAAPLESLGLRRISIADRPDGVAMLSAIGAPESGAP